MAFTVTTLDSSQLVTFHNSPNSRARETIDARLLNSNFASYLTTLNTLITETITEDSNNMKLTGNQTASGIKTFSDGISAGIVDEFLVINSDLTTAEVDSGIRVNRGSTSVTDAEIRWVVADDLFKFTIDSGTTLSKIQHLAGVSGNDGAVWSQVVKNTGNETVAGIKTFSSFPLLTGGTPSTDTMAAHKKYVDDTTAAIVAGAIFQQAFAPAQANNRLWIDTTTAASPIFYRSDGITFYEITPRTWQSGLILNFGTNRLRNIGTPVLGTDAATKDYADAASVFVDYGDGSDGDVDITSGAFTSGPITSNALTRDAFFDDLTLSGGNLNPAGFRLFIKGICTINPTFKIFSNGANGTNGGNGGNGAAGVGGAAGTAGTAGAAVAAGYFPASTAGQNGGTGGLGVVNAVGNTGGNGVAGTNVSNALGTNGSAGGAGGDGGDSTVNAGGSAGTLGAGGTATALAAAAGGVRNSTNAILWRVFNSTTTIVPNIAAGAGSGGGGGSGGSTDTGNGSGGGGGGGGSGSTGGFILVTAKTLINNGTIEAIGGNGGNGGNGGDDLVGAATAGGGGAGGGAGADGGAVITIANSRSGSGTISVTGGTGGTKGIGNNGEGTGAGDGTDGAAGTSGITIII